MKYDYVILGAGLAGLAFAYEVSKAGKSVLLLEAEDKVGGLSRTVKYDGFEFDFCAHRFHSANTKLLEEMKQLVPTFKPHDKKSRIFMFDKYLKYPFELTNLLRAMNPFRAAFSGMSFMKNQLTRKWRKKEIVTYKDWFVHFFGEELYKVMCLPYTSKIWKTDPKNLSADWADQRMQGVNIKALMQKTIKKVLRLDFSKYSLEDESLAPDGGTFYYGDHGIQELPDAFLKSIIRHKGKAELSIKLSKVHEKKLTVDYYQNGVKKSASAKEAIIDTIPLQAYYGLLDNRSEEVENTVNKLKYMDIIFVFLMLNKKQVSNDHWLYFAEKDIIFNRLVEFKNWSKKMTPPDKTAVCLDITSFENDATWKMSDSKLIEESIKSAKKAGLFSEKDVFDSKVVRIKNAYPFYDLDYKRKLAKVVKFIEKSNKVFCLGRTGLFRYNNADNSIEMGLELARRLIEKKSNPSLMDYSFKQVSY